MVKSLRISFYYYQMLLYIFNPSSKRLCGVIILLEMPLSTDRYSISTFDFCVIALVIGANSLCEGKFILWHL